MILISQINPTTTPSTRSSLYVINHPAPRRKNKNSRTLKIYIKGTVSRIYEHARYVAGIVNDVRDDEAEGGSLQSQSPSDYRSDTQRLGEMS